MSPTLGDRAHNERVAIVREALARELGEITAMLRETTMRVGVTEHEINTLQAGLIKALAEVNAGGLRNVLLSALIGSCGGALAGATMTVVTITLLIRQGILN